jgi:hypothetical protein
MANRGGIREGAGRPKGSQNKITKDLKNMILGALSDVGGQSYLARQAIENPNAFMALLGKVLPTTLSAEAENQIMIESVQFRFSDEANQNSKRLDS